METCTSTFTPMEPGLKMSKVDCPHTNEDLADIKQYSI